MRFKSLFLAPFYMLTLVVAAALTGCDDPIQKPDAKGCFQFQIDSFGYLDPELKKPILVLDVHVETCAGQGIPNLGPESFILTESDGSFSEKEGARLIVNMQSYKSMNTKILVDLSNSVISEGRDVKEVENSVMALKESLMDHAKIWHSVSVATFDGRSSIQNILDFANNKLEAATAISTISKKCPGSLCEDGSTNLWGAIQQSIASFDRFSDTSQYVNTLVVFTDGTDQANRVSERQALHSVAQFKAKKNKIFTVTVGDEISKDTLANLSTHNSEAGRINSLAQLKDRFKLIGRQLDADAHSYYRIGYCSPRRSSGQALKFKIKYQGTVTNEVTLPYDASSFSGNCGKLGKK